MKDSYVYFLTNWKNEVLYIGVTSNLERRIEEHLQKGRPGFTSKYNLKKLVYYEHFTNISAAIAREKQLKRWSRKKKNWLVDGSNPAWTDLYEDQQIRSLDFARDNSDCNQPLPSSRAERD